MTQADVAVELQYFLWMVGVVFVAGTLLGALASGARKSVLALVLATAFTAIGMLATMRPHETDGQTSLGIPTMWVPFFVASWLGLVIGAKLTSKKTAER
jgi:urea transporter